MDRVISLLAALVGLIALAGAVLVATNGDLERRELATQIAQLKTGMALTSQRAPDAIPSSASAPAIDDMASSIKQLEARIGTLEATIASQASALAAAPAPSSAPVAAPSSASASADENSVAMLQPSEMPSQAANPAALSADGPTKDCIPLGTRFMAKAGDNFPICKTKVVVKVAGVSDGLATLIGAGDIAAGATVPLSVAGCQAMVISADLSGYAELRVTCQ